MKNRKMIKMLGILMSASMLCASAPAMADEVSTTSYDVETGETNVEETSLEDIFSVYENSDASEEGLMLAGTPNDLAVMAEEETGETDVEDTKLEDILAVYDDDDTEGDLAANPMAETEAGETDLKDILAVYDDDDTEGDLAENPMAETEAGETDLKDILAVYDDDDTEGDLAENPAAEEENEETEAGETNLDDIWSVYQNNTGEAGDLLAVGPQEEESEEKSASAAQAEAPLYNRHVAYAQSRDKKLAGVWTIKEDKNLHCGAGEDTEFRLTMKAGDTVRCYGFYTERDGQKWLLVQYRSGKDLYCGFCSEEQLERSAQ